MSTEDVALRALRNATREHTSRAVILLAKHYGFDADEALGRIGLPACPRGPTHLPPSGDPVPVIGTSSDEDGAVLARCRKPRLTTSTKSKTATRLTRKNRVKKAGTVAKDRGSVLSCVL